MCSPCSPGRGRLLLAPSPACPSPCPSQTPFCHDGCLPRLQASSLQLTLHPAPCHWMLRAVAGAQARVALLLLAPTVTAPYGRYSAPAPIESFLTPEMTPCGSWMAMACGPVLCLALRRPCHNAHCVTVFQTAGTCACHATCMQHAALAHGRAARERKHLWPTADIVAATPGCACQLRCLCFTTCLQIVVVPREC